MDYVLVTVAMLGGAASAGAFAVGLVNDAFGSVAFTAIAMMVSASGAIVVGFPLWLLPLPLISGFYLARFFTKKSLPSYFTFVGLASLMVAWFVRHNFWDLNIWMAGMALKSFCKLIVASVIVAMAIPGLALLPSKLRFLTEIGLISHALLLCYIENRFFNYSSIYFFGFDDEVMYPSYMVIMTTFFGLALVRKLVSDHQIGDKAVWVLTCLYFAKLSMLFITSKSVLWMSAILLLAVSPPLLLYKDKTKVSSKMKVWQGYAHAGVVAVSAWLCRETVFEVLQWWNGRVPSDGLLMGSYILLTGLACIPIVALHFSHVQTAKRSLVLVIATGLLFIFMQPPISLSWAFQSTLINAAHQSVDDVSIYGFIATKPSWPSLVAYLDSLAYPSSSHIHHSRQIHSRTESLLCSWSRDHLRHLHLCRVLLPSNDTLSPPCHNNCLCVHLHSLHPLSISIQSKNPAMGVCPISGPLPRDIPIGRSVESNKKHPEKEKEKEKTSSQICSLLKGQGCLFWAYMPPYSC
ncbi:hypothetical protein QJS10_CPB04g00086 [Acorus calamus]|uniref:No exine formation 1 n=1 Tax=Acorus calamus TaxID=4465 RepID=A0AAV9F2K8_ACOCL|nr:hypothetical protein QJS10_CPB04g00086 [Acorus calamus]